MVIFRQQGLLLHVYVLDKAGLWPYDQQRYALVQSDNHTRERRCHSPRATQAYERRAAEVRFPQSTAFDGQSPGMSPSCDLRCAVSREFLQFDLFDERDT